MIAIPILLKTNIIMSIWYMINYYNIIFIDIINIPNIFENVNKK